MPRRYMHRAISIAVGITLLLFGPLVAQQPEIQATTDSGGIAIRGATSVVKNIDLSSETKPGFLQIHRLDPPKKETLLIATEEWYALQRAKIQKELQDEIYEWAKWRLSIVTLLFGVIGYFGIKSFVREIVAADLKLATIASAQAQAVADLAKATIQALREEADEHRDVLNKLQSSAQKMNETLMELRSRIEAEGQRSISAASLKIDVVETEIAALREVVSKLAQTSERNKKTLEEYTSKFNETRQVAESSLAEFEENSKYEVLVAGRADSRTSQKVVNELISWLSKSGFKAAQAALPQNSKVNETVRIIFNPDAQLKAQSIERKLNELRNSQVHNCEVKLVSNVDRERRSIVVTMCSAS